MKVVVFAEFSAPFRPRLKVERYGPMRRYIWLWFSVGAIFAGFNDLLHACRNADLENEENSR